MGLLHQLFQLRILLFAILVHSYRVLAVGELYHISIGYHDKHIEVSPYYEFSFAVLMEAISILRIEPQSCRTFFAISSEIIFAFCAISIQYSVS